MNNDTILAKSCSFCEVAEAECEKLFSNSQDGVTERLLCSACVKVFQSSIQGSASEDKIIYVDIKL